MTTQRREVLMQFIRNKEEHLNVEKIYDIVKPKGIGVSTVYRSINIFVDLGILKEFRVDNTNYYELKMYAKKPLHIHFKCEKCRKIKDITDKEVIFKYLRINNLLEKEYNTEINDVDIMFHGLCSNCIDKNNIN
nr:transcriptional repressor [Anaeromonas gelatinilytica]